MPHFDEREAAGKRAIDRIESGQVESWLPPDVSEANRRGLLAIDALTEAEHPLPPRFQSGLGTLTARTVAPAKKREILAAVIGEEHQGWIDAACGTSWDDLRNELEALPASQRAAVAQRLCKLGEDLLPHGREVAQLDDLSLLAAGLARHFFVRDGGITPAEAALLRFVAAGRYGER